MKKRLPFSVVLLAGLSWVSAQWMRIDDFEQPAGLPTPTPTPPPVPTPTPIPGTPTMNDSYIGIWYSIGQSQTVDGVKVPKYSGGLGTYPANMMPMATYVASVNKTFFVYGGTTAPQNRDLQIMIGEYDHTAGTVSLPTVIRDSEGFSDAHANPAVAIGPNGHIFVFSATRHGFQGRIYRSDQPHDISSFTQVFSRYMAYPQPWYDPDHGFIFLFTQYTGGRELYYITSADGVTWTDPVQFAGFNGHYQSSMHRDGVTGTAFNFHPGGVDNRTNIYYMQTADHASTWTAISGTALTLPLENKANPALVHDYQAEDKLVYIHDTNFDTQGRPVILYLTSDDHRAGPGSGTRQWKTAAWNGTSWERRNLGTSQANYDVGCLHIDAGPNPGEEVWRVTGPTGTGPQEWGTGGEMVMWISNDRGATWASTALTAESIYNHTYARRPVPAHPDFYVYWADGHALQQSVSRLYFASQQGAVSRLPVLMQGATAPEAVPTP